MHALEVWGGVLLAVLNLVQFWLHRKHGKKLTEIEILVNGSAVTVHRGGNGQTKEASRRG